MDMTNLHRSPPMNQSETDLGIVNESQLLGFGISSFRRKPRDLSFGSKRLSLPSERLAIAHADARMNKITD
jgi:hypothetical protein